MSDKEDKPWQFRKGQSGNPNGRPKGSKSSTPTTKDMLELVSKNTPEAYEKLLTIMRTGGADLVNTQMKAAVHYITAEQKMREILLSEMKHRLTAKLEAKSQKLKDDAFQLKLDEHERQEKERIRREEAEAKAAEGEDDQDENVNVIRFDDYKEGGE